MKANGFLYVPIIISVLFQLTTGDTHILYNTKTATSDLHWTLHPETEGWEELSGLDVDGNTIRSYQVCNAGMENQDNWARSPYIDAKSAKRIYMDIEFSVMKCPDCRETFTLYYYPSSSNVASSTFPPWQEYPFVKIDTVAASERFDSGNAGPEGINKKTLVIGSLERRGFYIAAQDQGACMSLMSLKLYYHYCPEITHKLAYFPKTVAGGDVASLIPVDGKCVSNSVYSNNEVPRYRCNSNGEWKVPTGMCQCRAGYTPNVEKSACRACPVGYYKSTSGNHECSPCPSHSSAHHSASTFCKCKFEYYRADSESIESACTRPPMGPNNLTYHMDKISIQLHWQPPIIAGDRDDLYYSVGCKHCDSGFEKCDACPQTVDFVPLNHHHVTTTSMNITDLEPFSYYIFSVTSQNGVSSVSRGRPSSESIHVFTGDAVPSTVELVQLLSKSMSSLTLEWSAPRKSKAKILDYEIHAQAVRGNGQPYNIAPLTFSVPTRNVTMKGLSSGTSYLVKIRARSVSGFGPYSAPVTFATQETVVHTAAPVTGGGTSVIAGVVGGVVGLLLLVVVIVLCRRKRTQRFRETARARTKLADTEAATGLINHDTFKGSVAGAKTCKTYVDYRDPHQGVKEIACEIDVSRIKIERVIGRGEFGEVCRGKLSERKTQSSVAVKRLKHGASLIDQTNFLREACTMAQFCDPNIVQFKGVVTKSMPAMIVTEFMENGSLDKFLQRKRGELSLLQLLQMLKGIASGMRYLSNMKYVHRDLAARNILVNSDLVCKVSDFGLSRTLENDPHATYTTQGGKIALRWTAPECIRYRQFTSASDVWSYGIVMWEVMSYGEKPYWDMSNDDVTEVIEDGYRLPAPVDCPQIVHNLMLLCWSYEPRRRPNFYDIFSEIENCILHPNLLQSQTEMADQSAPLLNPDSPTSLQDVSNLDEWLDMVKLGRYRGSFYAHGIKDLESLAHISPSDLERLGIASPAHRSRLQSELNTLRRHLTAPGPPASPGVAPGMSNTLRLSSDISTPSSPQNRSSTLPTSPQRHMRDVNAATVI